VFVQRLSSTRKGARLARLLTLHQLDEWGLRYDSESSDAAAASVAELAANAVIHGRVPGRDFELRVALTAARTIRIEVSDTRTESRSLTRPAAPAPDAETGSGRVPLRNPSTARRSWVDRPTRQMATSIYPAPRGPLPDQTRTFTQQWVNH
jgi:hypothetical protein